MEDVIDKNSSYYKELTKILDTTINTVEYLSAHAKPMICGERYFTGEQICLTLHISKRTLQEYRDS